MRRCFAIDIKMMPIESIGGLILILLNSLLLPLGIWILFKVNYLANKWHEKSKKRVVVDYIYVLRFFTKTYTDENWNKFIFKISGIICILIGSISVVYLIMYFIT
ncbi:hypothetical protein [Tissierella carlieri]|uniref:hypothetical protein n=1 Tax=Tissierella carlieri TaxID=689904 RepID=UPI00210A1363|nr:hypothetical protein [Tissierella carlieri]